MHLNFVPLILLLFYYSDGGAALHRQGSDHIAPTPSKTRFIRTYASAVARTLALTGANGVKVIINVRLTPIIPRSFSPRWPSSGAHRLSRCRRRTNSRSTRRRSLRWSGRSAPSRTRGMQRQHRHCTSNQCTKLHHWTHLALGFLFTCLLLQRQPCPRDQDAALSSAM